MELEFDPLFQCVGLLIEIYVHQKLLHFSTQVHVSGVTNLYWVFFFVAYICFFGMTGDYRQIDSLLLKITMQFQLYIYVCTSLFNNGEYIQLVCSSPPVVLFMTFFRKMSQLSNFLRGCCLFAPSVHFKMEGIYV